jgi:hypothetical protein
MEVKFHVFLSVGVVLTADSALLEGRVGHDNGRKVIPGCEPRPSGSMPLTLLTELSS